MHQDDLSEEELRLIEQGLREMEAGQTVPWEEVRQRLSEMPPKELTWFGRLLVSIKNWFNKNI